MRHPLKIFSVLAATFVLTSCSIVSGGQASSSTHTIDSLLPSSQEGHSAEETSVQTSTEEGESISVSSQEEHKSEDEPMQSSEQGGSAEESTAPASSAESSGEELGVVLSVDGATTDEEKMSIYMFVEKEISSVSLSTLVHVSPNTSWKLYRGEQEIPTKIATTKDGELIDGDNRFFILTSANNGLIEKTYELTIYRSFMVDVSYFHRNSLIHTDSVATGHDYEIINHFDIVGYSYEKLLDEKGEEAQGKIVPWSDLNFYVVASAHQHTVTLDPNGGTVLSSTFDFEYDSAYQLPTPEKKGYQFLGWFDNGSLFPSSGVWQKDFSVNLQAHWQIITYTISYDAMGGTFDPLSNPSTYTVEDDDIFLQDPSKFGHVSNGWIDSSGAKVEVIPHGSTGNIALTASFEAIKYHIVYLIDEETQNPNPSEYTVNDGILYLDSPTKGDLGFYGWTNEKGEIVTSIDCSLQEDGVVLKPNWGTKGLKVNNEGTLTRAPNVSEAIIPATVTSIGSYAFQNCSSLTSVTIPNSVASIGSYAFQNCSSLTSVAIPNSVTSIGERAFYGCTSLTSIAIPDSVTSIGNYAFYRCSSLTSVTIPDSVTSIGIGTFAVCSSLTSVTIPDSVISINEAAFSGCSSLTSVTIPDSVISIGYRAFENCSSLKSITLPFVGGSRTEKNFLGYIFGATAYYGNASYVPQSLESVFLGEACTSIDYETFYGLTCQVYIKISSVMAFLAIKRGYQSVNIHLMSPDGGEITDVTIPDSVLSIDAYTFNGCSSLTSIIIPDSVTSIGGSAFQGCSSLTSVTIPDSVISIGGSAFHGCTSLTSIIIPDSVTSIGEFAFQGCSSLTSIIIPDSVTSIGSYAFQNCSSLTSIIIPDSVTSIGKQTFYGCTSLASVTIPDSVTSIDELAFSGCSSLTSVTIPDSVASIEDGAFRDCPSLTDVYFIVSSMEHFVAMKGKGSLGGNVHLIDASTGEEITDITIPDSVTSIERYAFRNCSSLASVTIPDSVTFIGYNAFENCASLVGTLHDGGSYLGNADNECLYLLKVEEKSVTSFQIADGCRFIDSQAFANCSYLSSITIPDSVVSILDVAIFSADIFRDCDYLENIYFIVSSMERFVAMKGKRTLRGNVHLIDASTGEEITDITIPDSVTSFDDYAFSRCSSLTSVVIPDSMTSIGYCAFLRCSSLRSVTIPDSVTSIQYYAFDGCDSLATIFYGGSQSQWDALSGKNHLPSSAKVYFYSEWWPSTNGDYWHYVNGVPTIW